MVADRRYGPGSCKNAASRLTELQSTEHDHAKAIPRSAIPNVFLAHIGGLHRAYQESDDNIGGDLTRRLFDIRDGRWRRCKAS